MGRRRDPPALQKAKGFPGKRKTKAEKRLEESQALAALLAGSAKPGEHMVAPPAFLDDLYPLELALWREFAPGLTRLNILRDNHRLIFAGFCVHYAQWIRATSALRENGEVQRVKQTNASFRDRPSPWFEIQKSAWSVVLDLSARFGLDPASGYRLFRDQAAVAPGSDLFAPAQSVAPAAGAAKPDVAADPSPLGAMDAFDSLPPGAQPN